MADRTRSRAFLAAAAISLSSGATAMGQVAVTDPVGFITQGITGTGGETDKTENLVTVGFVGSTAVAAEVASVVDYRISTVGTDFAADEFNLLPGSHYVEVRSGAGAGLVLEIVGTGASYIDVARLPGGRIAAGDRVYIRGNFTVGGLFGPVGEAFYSEDGSESLLRGTDPAACDNIILLDPETKVQRVFYLHGDAAAAEWREVGAAGDASARPVRYPLGIMVVRRGATDLEFLNVGHVPFYNEDLEYVAFLEVWPGENFISMPLNNATLDSSGLYSATTPWSVVGGSDPTTADVLILNSGTDRFAPAYYRDGVGWRRVGVEGDAGAWQFPFYSSARFYRQGEQTWLRFETGFADESAKVGRRGASAGAGVVKGLRIARDARRIALTWPTVSGGQYQVQTRPASGSDPWLGLPTIYNGDGSPMAINHSAVGGGEQLRVIQTQGK